MFRTVVPPWRAGQAIDSWREIPGSSLSRVPPSVMTRGDEAARIDAWVGLAVDERAATLYAGAGGGDWTYAGNEVVAIDLASEAPAWRELRASTPLASVTEGQSHYLDGRPASRQTHYSVVFAETQERLMIFGGDVLGHWTATVDAFDPVRGDWDGVDAHPAVPLVTDGETPSIAEDATTGDVWVFGNAGAHRWIAAEDRWENAIAEGSLIQSGFGLAAAIDPTRRRILLVGNGSGHAFWVSLVDRSFVDAGPIDLGGRDVNAGLVFVPEVDGGDAFLLRGREAGGGVLRIDAETLAVTELGATGGDAIPAALNGVHGRFRAVPSLGGVVYYPAYVGNVWFLRTGS